jgi:GH18 family chitinase
LTLATSANPTIIPGLDFA